VHVANAMPTTRASPARAACAQALSRRIGWEKQRLSGRRTSDTGSISMRSERAMRRAAGSSGLACEARSGQAENTLRGPGHCGRRSAEFAVWT
jgi:hypothetical protein